MFSVDTSCKSLTFSVNMCALRDFNSVKPSLLAHQYRLNISQHKKKPVNIERKRKVSKVPQLQTEATDTNASTRFSSKVWLESSPSVDDDLGLFDSEEEILSELFTPTAPEKHVHEMILRVYEAACKKLNALPLSCIKTGLLKEILACKFMRLQKNDCMCICYAMCKDHIVEKIEFQQNGIGPEPAKYFAEVLKNSVFLTHVKIAENDLKSEGARVICKAVKENSMIVSLDLSGNGLVESDGEVIEDLIAESSSLTELYLAHNELMDHGVRQISQALQGCITLRVLDLSWNHIRQSGAVSIGEALENNNTLEKVNLAWNGLHLEGAKSIAKALQKNDTLTEIDLTNNRLTEYCIAEILKGLDNNSTLKILRIGQNYITTRGALSILQHLKENKVSAISVLDLGGQEVHDKFEELCREIERERDFKAVYGNVWKADRVPLSQSSVEDDEKALLSYDALTVLIECIRLQNMCLIDIFKCFDTDKSSNASINEFCEGMLNIGIQIRKQALLSLLQKLDVDQNRQLDYRKLAEAQQRHKQNLQRILDSGTEFEKTEIGKISVILRRIMKKQPIMKKSSCDSRIKFTEKSKDNASRSSTPLPFQLEDVETRLSLVDLMKNDAAVIL